MSTPNSQTRQGQPGDRCVMVVCGATGDLTKRKLLPALYNLAQSNLLSREFAIVGFSRLPQTSEAFRAQLGEDMKTFVTGGALDPEIWDWLARRIYYVSGEFNDPAAYQRLRDTLTQVDTDHCTHGNYFYYLAVAPGFFGEIVRQLGAAGLTGEDNGRWRRVIIEKPFGRDLESARALNAEIKQRARASGRSIASTTTWARRPCRT